jgi:hypothetical protein
VNRDAFFDGRGWARPAPAHHGDNRFDFDEKLIHRHAGALSEPQKK